MFRFTLKNIWAHKMRLALSMLSIFLGVAFLAGTLVFTATIERSFDDLFTSVFKKTDAVVQSTKTTQNEFEEETRRNIPRTLLPIIEEIPGVREVEGEVFTAKLVVLDNKGKKLFSSQGPPTMGFGLPKSTILTQWILVGDDGQNLSTQDIVNTVLADDEVLVDKSTSDAHNLKIGKTIRVLTPEDVRTFTIKGYVRFGTADGVGGAAAFVFNDKQAGEIFNQTDTFSQISVAADEGVSQEELAKRIDAALAKEHKGDYETITGKELIKQSQQDIKEFLTFFTVFLLVFAFISFFVALIIIVNSFAIIMTQRKREYALLRAIGATGPQVLRSVLGESLVVGFVASAFGVAGGVGLSVSIKALMDANGLKLPAGPLVIPNSAIITGMLVGTVATVASAFFPAWHASRVSPIEALRETAFEKNRRMIFRIIFAAVVGLASVATIVAGYKAKSGERLTIVGFGIALLLGCIVIALPLLVRPFTALVGSRISGLVLILFGGRRAFGITGEIARRNNNRNPRRSARTSLALMIGVALVVFITVFASSATATFTNYLTQNYASDLIVGDFNSLSSGLSAQRCDAINKEPYVEASSCLRASRLQFSPSLPKGAEKRASSETASVFGVDSSELSKIFTIKYKGTVDNLGDNGIAITSDITEKQNIKLGGTVSLEGQLGKRDFTVKAILDEGLLGPGQDTIVIDNNALNALQDEQPAIVSMVVIKDGIKTTEAKSKMEDLLANTGIEVNDLKTSRDQMVSSINSVLTFVYGLLGLAIIIASIGILNTMSLSILERRRELGLMRAVGTTKAQVRGFVRFESIILAVLGTTVGMLFGVGSGYIFVKALKEEGFTSFSVAPATLITILFTSAFIGVAAGAWPAWRATKVDVLKAVTVE